MPVLVANAQYTRNLASLDATEYLGIYQRHIAAEPKRERLSRSLYWLCVNNTLANTRVLYTYNRVCVCERASTRLSLNDDKTITLLNYMVIAALR